MLVSRWDTVGSGLTSGPQRKDKFSRGHRGSRPEGPADPAAPCLEAQTTRLEVTGGVHLHRPEPTRLNYRHLLQSGATPGPGPRPMARGVTASDRGNIGGGGRGTNGGRFMST